MARILITFGALADPMIAQLPEPVRNRRTWLSCCKTWQEDADALSRLIIHHHLSAREGERGRQRLLKTIAYFYKKHKFLHESES